MARFRFGTGTYDTKSKMIMNADVTVYSKNVALAKVKALKLIGKPGDIYLKEIEETPDDKL